MDWEAVAKLNDGISSRAMTVQRLLRRNATEFAANPLAQVVLLAKKLESHFTPEQMQSAADLLANQRSNFPSVELSVTDGYAVWAEHYDAEKNPLIFLEEPAMLALLGEVAGKDVLDAACGTGRWALRMAEMGARVWGVDATAEMLAIAQAKQAGNCHKADFMLGSVTKLPFVDGSFDLVTCALALSHVADLQSAISEFARVLRPGGQVLISDFHPFCLQVGWRAVFVQAEKSYFIANQEHLTQDYLNALWTNGFEVGKFTEEVVDDRLLELWPQAEVERFRGLPAVLILEATKKEA